MTAYIWSQPVARKPHTCTICYRKITPGEPYARMAGLDCGTAWTYKECQHCHRATVEYCAAWDAEYEPESVREWLEDSEPLVWSQMLAGWRTPEGDLLPPPFEGQR